MTNIGAGLAAARPARPIRPGERIHVVGIAGAGASAAAILAARAGAVVSGCDPGGPSPYTRGGRVGRDPDRLVARRRPCRGRTAAGPPGRHEGADRHRSGSPRAGRRTRRRHPGRAVATGDRGFGCRQAAHRGRGDPRQEHDIRLAGACPRGAPARIRAPSSARCCRRRSPVGRQPPRDGARGPRSWSRPMSTPATSMPITRTSRSSRRRNGTTPTCSPMPPRSMRPSRPGCARCPPRRS